MKNLLSRQRQAKVLRIFRKVHRVTGASLFVFFFIIAITGVLLGWKKNSDNLILPKNQQGQSVQLNTWISIDSLHKNACTVLKDSISPNISLKLDRIDIRKDKGIAKFIFEEHNWQVQLDGSNGKLLHLGKRHSDFIEDIHDGSIVDTMFQTSAKPFKVIYTTIMGLSLLLFTITGFWLWYGPKKLRRQRFKNRK